jgi:ectoine hydroxylase-related dioxygenase (phytanoyl-CoA dioxygenase family)
MDIHYDIKEKISRDGFAIVENIFTDEEINKILSAISQADNSKPTFRKTTALIAIRQFFKEVPEAAHTVFSDKLNHLITELFGDEFFVVKSIYFEKPKNSNWFVSYHQDLTISVNTKLELDGYGPWTTKHNQFAVQPPSDILQDNFTIRIHLDNATGENGALRVIPGSHLKGVYRPETIDWAVETETICSVPKGGIMFMKPLILHSSNRTTNSNKRRVIHIEFSKSSLPDNLNWAEFMPTKVWPNLNGSVR